MKRYLLTLVLGMELGCMRTHSGPLSDHFDGEHFFIPWGGSTEGLTGFLKWQLTDSKKGPFPAQRADVKEVSFPSKPQENRVHVTLVNHATLLIQLPHVTILTDPIWSQRASPVSFAGPARIHPPVFKLDALKGVDYVIVSHNHYDHLDLPTLQTLSSFKTAKIFVPLGDAFWLQKENVTGVTEFDWWQEYLIDSDTKLIFAPAQHWSSRTPWDRNKSLWGSWILTYKGQSIYFAGDTGLGPHFKEIRKRVGPMKVALLPIGAYEPRWFMKFQHMNPEDAVLAHKELESEKSLGIHFGCFQLTNEGFKDPESDLQNALEKHNVTKEHFVAPIPGQLFDFDWSSEPE